MDGMLETVELDERARCQIGWLEQLGDYELEGSIGATVGTWAEFHVRETGNVVGSVVGRNIDPGWHRFRVVAIGTDVTFFLDDAPSRFRTATSVREHSGSSAAPRSGSRTC